MPDAKPKVHDLQARYREIAAEPYTFTWADREWTVPHMRELDYRILTMIEGFDQVGVDEAKSLFDSIFGGGEQAEAWDRANVPAGFLLFLFEDWTEYSGGEQGEDEASKPSSKSTGTKSRRTSGTTTTSASPKRSTAKRAPRKAASPRVKSST